MEYRTVLVEREGGIGTITLNRPDKLNAFTPELFQEFIDALLELDADAEVRVVMITGAGKAFTVGLDVGEASKGPSDFDKQVVPLQGTLAWTAQIMRNLKKPILCAINGVAVGAGFSIALASDIRIMADGAKIGGPFLRVGLVPEMGSTYNLPRLVGMGKACELVFTGKVIDAKEAQEIGLVNFVVPGEELEKETKKLAMEILKAAPIALQLARKALYQGMDCDLPTQVQFEQLSQSTCFRSEDYLEGLKAFLEKRKPQFRGR
ncbi:MAG: enoyl-CoA hydratase/isomerase family protein [Thermodesulfobacteriota bacterium]